MESASAAAAAADAAGTKRKRSPSISSQPLPAPPAKILKSHNQLSINYLARASTEDLPLLNKDDTLPNLLQLLSAYSSVLDRHESLASNLGARPLGPILIKRFERCFDAPPKVVASHHKGSTSGLEDSSHSITWLEVIEFARSHPSQFTLSTFSEGRRVCQFYYPQKQLRVQISEEDFLFINSGRCQELIPPLPIWEDEEKEVGACDVLDGKLKELTNIADMVAARTRQLSHRLKGRRAAILERRAEGGSGTPAKASAPQTTTAPPTSGSGFIAVNNTEQPQRHGHEEQPVTSNPEAGAPSFSAVRSELLRHFESLPHNQNQGRVQSRHASTASLGGYVDVPPPSRPFEPTIAEVPAGRAGSTASSLSPVPPTDPLSYYTSDAAPAGRQSLSGGHRPSSSTGNHGYSTGSGSIKHNFSRPLAPALESSQPFRPLCQAHMDSLPRGHRVIPPCDRCRRLRMDCVKNLTSCQGCTKKHARCHWRDVNRDELGALDHLMDAAYSEPGTNGYANGSRQDESEDEDSNPLEDLEALGEKEERENEAARQSAEQQNSAPEQANELARQGWEESLRTAQLGGSSKPAGPATDQQDDNIQVVPRHRSAEPKEDDNGGPKDVTPRPAPAGLSALGPHFDRDAGRSSVGGFRPVNDAAITTNSHSAVSTI